VCSLASLFERQTSETQLLPYPVTHQEFALNQNKKERNRGIGQANRLSLKALLKHRSGTPALSVRVQLNNQLKSQGLPAIKS
jgi:hypothetical protein